MATTATASKVTTKITPENFWSQDLDVVEASFLGDKKITDLPTTLNDKVPAQGSVLLNRVVNIDERMKSGRCNGFFSCLIGRFKLG